MVNVTDASFMFGDNFLVVNFTVMRAGKLQHRSRIINYHRTRESQAKGVIKFVHMNGNESPADIVTKSRAYNTWFHLMKPLMFWSDMEFSKSELLTRGVKTDCQHLLSLNIRALYSSP